MKSSCSLLTLLRVVCGAVEIYAELSPGFQDLLWAREVEPRHGGIDCSGIALLLRGYHYGPNHLLVKTTVGASGIFLVWVARVCGGYFAC
jgi:hypothetical protein